MPQKRKKAVVVGVGPIEGLGGGVARRFAANGCHVLVAGRTREKLDLVVEHIRQAGGSAIAVPTDASDPAAVEALFGLVAYLCRSGCSFRLPGVRRPGGFCLPKLNAFGAGYRSR